MASIRPKAAGTKKEDSPFPGFVPNFITNQEGKKIGVFIEIDAYEDFLEELEDFYLGAIAGVIKRKNEGERSLEEVKKDLKKKRRKSLA